MRCQRLYLGDRRCRHEQFQGGELCRWHVWIDEMCSMYQRAPLWEKAWAALGLIIGPRAIWDFLPLYSRTRALVWLSAALGLTGVLVCMFGASVIRPGYPLSQAPVCAKLLAVGLVFAAVGAYGTGMLITDQPEAIVTPLGPTALVGALGNSFGPPVLAALCAILGWFATLILTVQILSRGTALFLVGLGATLLTLLLLVFAAWSFVRLLVD